MDPIHRVTGGPAATARPARPAAAGFRLPAAGAEAAPPAGRAEAIGLPGMLLLQEQPDTADRQARRRGQDILAALAELQRALLGDGAVDAARLTALVANLPQAADPALRAAVQAIALRARIEVAHIEAAQREAAHVQAGCPNARAAR